MPYTKSNPHPQASYRFYVADKKHRGYKGTYQQWVIEQRDKKVHDLLKLLDEERGRSVALQAEVDKLLNTPDWKQFNKMKEQKEEEIGELTERLASLEDDVNRFAEQWDRVFNLGQDNPFERKELDRLFDEINPL